MAKANEKKDKSESRKMDLSKVPDKSNMSDLIAKVASQIQGADFTKKPPTEFISTGLPILDLCVGGGFPKGEMTELYGDFSTGKSLLAACAVANLQRTDPKCIVVYDDVERTLNHAFCAIVGVDESRLIYKNSRTIEEHLETVHKMALLKKEMGDEIGDVLIIWDSLAATASAKELKQDFGDPEMAVRAQVISQGVRMILADVYESKVTWLILNQIRSKIGVMFGQDWDTVGGNTVKFHASLRIHLKKGKLLKDGEKNIGREGSFETTKNKNTPPFQSADFSISFGQGFDPLSGMCKRLEEDGMLQTKNGGWYLFGDKIQFQSKDFLKAVEENPVLRDTLQDRYNIRL